MKIHLLTLKMFSATGGIEKLSRIIGKVLVDEYAAANEIKITSLHDGHNSSTQPYFDNKYFTGLASSKLSWLGWLLGSGRNADLLIISHSNILPLAKWVKKLNKNCKVILVAHGIEVWKPVKHIEVADNIVAVSNYTAGKLITENNIAKKKITVINNCIDPFLTAKATDGETVALNHGFGIKNEEPVLLALTRLADTERYKGYDKVINVLGKIKSEKQLHIHYVIAGKYSSEEQAYIMQVAQAAGMQGLVHLPGFVSDDNLPAYFKMADAYILPSKKEGFGITFIEAIHYGLPVIAGNQDGSVDALLNGALGTLVNPDDEKEIEAAIIKLLSNPLAFVPNAELVEKHFGYDRYKDDWKRFVKLRKEMAHG